MFQGATPFNSPTELTGYAIPPINAGGFLSSTCTGGVYTATQSGNFQDAILVTFNDSATVIDNSYIALTNKTLPNLPVTYMVPAYGLDGTHFISISPENLQIGTPVSNSTFLRVNVGGAAETVIPIVNYGSFTPTGVPLQFALANVGLVFTLYARNYGDLAWSTVCSIDASPYLATSDLYTWLAGLVIYMSNPSTVAVEGAIWGPITDITGATCDPIYVDDSVLLLMEGTNGSTTFLDSSNNNLSCTSTGATLTAIAPLIAPTCGDFSTGGGVRVPSGSAGGPMDFCQGDFTLEFWMRTSNTGQQLLAVNSGPSGGHGLFMYLNGGGTSITTLVNGGGLGTLTTPGGTYDDGVWHHIALVSSNGKWQMFADGLMGSQTTALTIGGPPTIDLAIGNGSFAGVGISPFVGQMQGFRVTKGFARYLTNFIPTAPFLLSCPVLTCDPDYSSVGVLMHFDGTNGQTTTVDSGPDALALTMNGSAVLDTASPEFGSASVNFPSTSTFGLDSVAAVVAPGGNLDLFSTTADFTIEFWFKSVGGAGVASWLVAMGNPSSLDFLNFTAEASTNTVGVHCGSATFNSAGLGTPIAPGVYSHLALVRAAGRLYLYVNGSVQSTVGTPMVSLLTATYLSIGHPFTAFGGADPFQMDEFRVTAGVARYNSNFVPEGPFPSVACVSFADVPDVTNLDQRVAESDITAAGFIVGTETTASSTSVPVGFVISQSPTGGTSAALGSPVDLVISSGLPLTVVPAVTLIPAAAANTSIFGAGLSLGTVTTSTDPSVPAGSVISQDPAAGAEVLPGSPVSYVVSTGAPLAVVPEVIGLLDAQARALFAAAGIPIRAPLHVTNIALAGFIIAQSPAGGTPVQPGAIGQYTISDGPAPAKPFDVEATVISQYANSPTLMQLVQNMNQYIRQDVNFEAFFDFVWNVNTAQGFGLDIWGRIVDIPRLLEIPSSFDLFGFGNDETPPGVLPFNQGVFNTPGSVISQSYLLPDDAYRTLILVKALANISATTAPAINQLLRNLFPGRGAAYVLDLGGMKMQFTFEFQLTPTEYAILSQSGALPHPAGVGVTIVTIASNDIFGFVEASPGMQTFGNGAFYTSP